MLRIAWKSGAFATAITLLLSTLVQPNTASANIVTYSISGTLNNAVGSLPVGTLFSGFFTYDDTVVDGNPGNSTNGDYEFITAELTISTDTVVLQNLVLGDNLSVGNSPSQYVFNLLSASAVGTLGGESILAVQLRFVLEPNTVGSDALPGAGLTIADFDFGQLIIAASDLVVSNGTIDSLSSVSPVPLPAALPLFGTGLAIMGLLGWHRRRRAIAA